MTTSCILDPIINPVKHKHSVFMFAEPTDAAAFVALLIRGTPKKLYVGVCGASFRRAKETAEGVRAIIGDADFHNDIDAVVYRSRAYPTVDVRFLPIERLRKLKFDMVVVVEPSTVPEELKRELLNA